MTENLLQNRYGYGVSHKRDRIIAVGIALSAILGFAAWAIWFTIDNANQVSSRDVGFTVIDELSTEVVFEVTRNPGQEVLCDIQVLNQSFAVVGFKTVAVAPSTGRSVVISTVVNTTELGTTGLVDSCR